MSALEQAVANRPGWEMRGSKAVYTSPAVGNVATLGWREEGMQSAGWEWEISRRDPNSPHVSYSFSKVLEIAIESVEVWTDKP